MTTATFVLGTICSFLFLGGILYGLYREGLIIEFANFRIYKRDNETIERKLDGE
jgi:hypothetical protein